MFKNLVTPNLIENLQISAKISIILGTIPSIVLPSLSSWFIMNVDYVSFALGAIALDHALGSYVHKFISKDWNWQKNIGGFGIKLSMVVAFGFLIEGLSHITIEDDFVYRYIKMAGRLIVIIYPTLSAAKNIKIITKGAFPPDAIVGKLENFNKNMDLNEFRDKGQNPSIYYSEQQPGENFSEDFPKH